MPLSANSTLREFNYRKLNGVSAHRHLRQIIIIDAVAQFSIENASYNYMCLSAEEADEQMMIRKPGPGGAQSCARYFKAIF